jgi:glycerol kinase
MERFMSDKTHLLAIDQGTTSSRTMVFASNGDIGDVQQKELALTYPHDGWVEQDASEIWADTLECLKGSVQNHSDKIAALGITNQRETTILWNRITGEPVYNAIVWQDRRAAALCLELKGQGLEAKITEKTGLLLDPYFSATKIAWILEHVDGAREAAQAGDLAFGTVECFLLWNLTGGRAHMTDITNASRTMLCNIHTGDWDDELLEIFNIPRSILPDIKPNTYDFGVIADDFPGAGLRIAGMAGDQQAALIGQACFEPGMMKATYGTGAFALLNIGDTPKLSENRLLTTVAYQIGAQIIYAIEGSVFVAGAAIQWLRDGLEMFDNAAQSEALATGLADNGDVYFVPSLTGLGAPYWRPDARGMIVGITRDTTKAHIARAALEAQAYQTLDLLQAMERDAGQKSDIMRVDGGLVVNEFMCQHLADMLQMTIDVPVVRESTAWGAACLAGLQVGVFGDLDDVSKNWTSSRTYQPVMAAQEREALYEGWKAAIAMLLSRA